MTDNTRRNGPTRRATIKYGGTVVSGGLLAGCTGGSEESTPETDPTTNESYSVTMEPMGTVEFDDPPEEFHRHLGEYRQRLSRHSTGSINVADVMKGVKLSSKDRRPK